MKRTKPSKSSQAIERKKPGRKSKYEPWMAVAADRLIGKLGMRNKDLALYFEVDETTIDKWIRDNPDFSHAVNHGRVSAGMEVAQSLFKKANGCEWIDSQVFQQTTKEYYDNGKVKSTKTEPIIIQVPKTLPPDAYAAHKFLTVMFREVWSENSHHTIDHRHSGEITHKKVEELSLDDMSKEMKDLLFKTNLMQLSDGQDN